MEYTYIVVKIPMAIVKDTKGHPGCVPEEEQQQYQILSIPRGHSAEKAGLNLH